MITEEIIRKHFPFFKKIRYTYEPSKGAARTNLKTKELVLNNSKCTNMPFNHLFFILCHEEGHLALNTKDELDVDKYAFDKYEKYNLPNSDTVQVLNKHLDHKNPVHQARIFAQYQRALKNEYWENKNKKAYRKHYFSVAEIKQDLSNKL